MSTQKGNTKRTRPQKYQNNFAFKNNLHDKTVKTKTINSLQIANVCERCKKILEWKIKYKKYKPLKAPGKCNKCDQKTVKHAYHTMCGPCARERNICPKCEQSNELIEPQPTKEEQVKLDAEMQQMLKSLPERKRRTFMRYMDKQSGDKKKKKRKQIKKEGDDPDSEVSEVDEAKEKKIAECTREDLLTKLKTLMIDREDGDDEFDSDFDDDDLSDFADDESDDDE